MRRAALLIVLLLGGLALGCGDSSRVSAPGGEADSLMLGVIRNLRPTQVSDRAITLAWTSPGGRDSTVSVRAYDLRMSTSPITEAVWDSLESLPGLPVPLKPGVTQFHEITGLEPARTYHFAMRTLVQRGIWSDLSNPVSVESLGWMEASAPSFVGWWADYGYGPRLKFSTNKATALKFSHNGGKIVAFTNATRGAIQEFDLQGNLLRVHATGFNTTGFRDFTLLDDGSLCSAVVDGDRTGLEILDSELTLLGRIGTGPPSGRLGELILPADVVVTEDRVFVAERGSRRIQVFDPQGRFLNAWDLPGAPFSMALTPDGNLLLALSGLSGVWVYSQDGEQYGRIAEASVPYPWNIRALSDSTMWVSSSWRESWLKHIDQRGVVLDSLRLESQGGFEVDAEGFFYVVQNNIMQSRFPDGTLERQWWLPGRVPAQAFRLRGRELLIVGGDGRLYTSSRFGGEPRLIGSLNGPEGDVFGLAVSVVPHGDAIYIVDRVANRVRVHASDGSWIRTIGGAPDYPDELVDPLAVTRDDRGDLFVLDSGNNRVSVFDRGGALIRTIPASDDPLGPLVESSGLAVDHANRLFISERGAGRIRVYDTSGFHLRNSWEFRFGVGVSEWRTGGPGAIAVASDGTLFIQDHVKSIVVQFAPDGTYLSRIETYGPDQSRFSRVWDIITDDEGGIYVSGGGGNTLKFRLHDP